MLVPSSSLPTRPHLSASCPCPGRSGSLTGLLYLHTPHPDTHKSVILHRDIKPSNILSFWTWSLGVDKRSPLADMGLRGRSARRPHT